MATVFGLDLSYHAGWCLFDGEKLLESGTLHLDRSLDEYGPFPWQYQSAADSHADHIYRKIEDLDPDIIVIEAINKGKNRWSQWGLDMLHGELLRKLALLFHGKVVYIDSSAWRKTMDIKLDKAQAKNNAKVSKANRDGRSKKALGLKGKITKKHLAINKVNSLIEEGKLPLKPLKLKDNDLAEAILLTLAYMKGAPHSDPKRKER